MPSEAEIARRQTLINAAELAYSEMAFTLHDICDPRRRRDDDAWIERRGKTLAASADRLRAALLRESETKGGGDA